VRTSPFNAIFSTMVLQYLLKSTHVVNFRFLQGRSLLGQAFLKTGGVITGL
jgi:hypothetical protein